MLRIRIPKDLYHFQDPDPCPGCLGSGSVSYSNGKTKLIGRENSTENTFCVGPVGPTEKENQVKMYKKYCSRYHYLFETARIRIRIKQSDPDPFQSEKQDPDPYKKGLDPQHCLELLLTNTILLTHNTNDEQSCASPINSTGEQRENICKTL